MATEGLDIRISEKGGKVVKRSIEDIGTAAQKTDREIQAMNTRAVAVGNVIGDMITKVGGAFLRGIANFARGVKETATASKQLGIGVENFSRLDFAARSADMTTKDLVSTMQGLQRAQVQAAKPNTELNKLFAQMGINAVDATGKLRNTEEVLRDVADLFQRMPDGTNKSAIAMRLFGRENQDVIALLSQGSQGLDQMAKKSDELGYTLSNETAEGMKEFYDELDDVKLQIEGMYRQALPGLIPKLQELSGLLNSQEFKDGFNAIIQGAATAIIKLVEFAGTVGNVTKFLAEEVAARVGGTDATDTVRVEQRIERLQQTLRGLDSVQQRGFGAWFDPEFLKASEFKPSDFMKPYSEVRERLQRELDQEENKLELGMKWNAEEAERRLAAFNAAQSQTSSSGPAPNIDFTQLGRTGRGRKGPDPAKELERFERQLHHVLSAINPVLAAELDLARAHDVLGEAVERGLMSQQQATDYAEEYEYRLRDQLDPLGKVTRELEDQIYVAGLLNEERDVEVQMMGLVENLRRAGITLIDEETEALREQLRTLQAVDQLSAAREGMIAGSRGARDRRSAIDIEALSGLVGTEGFTEGDKFNVVNQMLGGTLDDTKMMFDAQMEQFQEYYARVRELRDADVLSAKEASDAMVAIKRAELDSNLARTEQALGLAALLMQSNSKEAFEVGRAAAIGQAIVNTYTAATAAYQSAAAIPFAGWLLGPVAAAGAIAAGMAQVSAIRSQQMPAYRTGGSYMVGGHGGTDSQTVAFRATPGEQININTPAQARAMERMAKIAERGEGGRGNFTQNVTIVQQGKADRKTAGQQARALRRQTRAEFERSAN